jgi:hypothetical protein
MPSLIASQVPARSQRDPEAGNEWAPIDDAPAALSERPSDSELAAYARQLWQELDRLAHYLRDEIARGGSGPVLADSNPRLATDADWQQWQQMYAGALSTLAGPAGDQGYGEQEARKEYQKGFLYHSS